MDDGGKEAGMISAKVQIAMLIAVGLYFLIVIYLLKRENLKFRT